MNPCWQILSLKRAQKQNLEYGLTASCVLEMKVLFLHAFMVVLDIMTAKEREKLVKHVDQKVKISLVGWGTDMNEGKVLVRKNDFSRGK